LRIKDGFDCNKQSGRTLFSKQIDFKNWTLKKLIGKGAYAKVFLITHTYPDPDIPGFFKTKEYALKVYNKQLLVESGLSESTMHEREILLEINHPYILKLHYAFQTTQRLYFVLDYVPGGDLF